MAQRYGLRASANLADVADNATCFKNLGLKIADFLAIANVAATGTKASDFQAIKGLLSPLEGQISSIGALLSSIGSGLALKALETGDTISGIVTVNGTVNGDRPFISLTGSGAIYNSASGSFFCPTSGSSFSSGAAYLSGPTRISGLTLSGNAGNYTGPTFPYNVHYENYKIYQRISDSGNTLYGVQTKLPSPTAFSGCVLWLDAEKSSFSFVSSGRISQWQSVFAGGVNASQTVSGSSPYYVASAIVDSGITKPGVAFSGGEFFDLGSLGGLFGTEATVVLMAEITDDDYSILGNTTSNTGRWRTAASGNGLWPLFCSSPIARFPRTMPANGTIVFGIRASQAYGLEVRSNGGRLDYLAPSGFVYQSSGQYLLATAPANSGRFTGRLYGIAGFSRILPDRELRTVEEYFLWRYNSVYDANRSQLMQLEDGTPLELENFSPLELG